MDSDILGRRAFSLIELGLVLMVVSLLVAVSSYSAARIRQVVKAQRTIHELDTLASVSTRYYLDHGAWPADTAGLRPGYIGADSSDLNPFGNAYTIAGNVSYVSVSTLLPKGLVTEKSFGTEVVVVNQGANDLASISKSLESLNWKLKYEKKYIYQE